MKLVRTTVLSFAVAGAATVGNLWAQNLAPLPDTSYPVYRSAYASQPDLGPIEADPDTKPAPQSGTLDYPAQPVPAAVSDSGCASGNCGNVYDEAMSSPWGDDCASTIEGGCPRRWYASAAGLIMGRDNSNAFWTSYDENNNANQIMNSRDAELSWGGGVDVSIGHCFGCGNAFEANYFGVWGMNGESEITSSVDDIGTPLDVTDGAPTIDGIAAADFFDNARAHRIERETEFHSVELNFLGNQRNCGPGLICGPAVNVSWLGGFRYFRLDDRFNFGSLMGDVAAGVVDPNRDWDTNGGAFAAYYDSDVANNLYGFQVGARADYQANHKLGLFFAPKVGLYGNHIQSRQSVLRGDGYTEFSYDSDKTDLSFLCQIDAGLNYRFSDRWSAFGGYRAVAITGVALSDHQIPHFLADTAGFQEINSGDSIILHGAFAGLEYRF